MSKLEPERRRAGVGSSQLPVLASIRPPASRVHPCHSLSLPRARQGRRSVRRAAGDQFLVPPALRGRGAGNEVGARRKRGQRPDPLPVPVASRIFRKIEGAQARSS